MSGRGEVTNKKAKAKPPAGAKHTPASSNGDASKHEVKTAAEAVTTLESHPDEKKAGAVDVTSRQHGSMGPEAVAGEAGKGYDLLVVGIAKTRDRKSGFSKEVSRIVEGFDGPVAVVNSHRETVRATKQHGRILVPVNGTDVSRRAVEVGLTLARAEDAEVTVLYVTRAAANGRGRKNVPRRRAMRRSERAVLADIAALAERYEVKLRTQTRANVAPDEAIIGEAKQGYDLVVLGVSRRPGDTLFFGNTATAVLDRSKVSNLFVAS